MRWVLALGLLLCTAPLPAQTRFLDADTTADYSRYQFVEDCIAATRRIATRIRNQQPVWRDTLASTRRDSLLDTLPTAAVQVAKQCSGKFAPTAAPDKHFDVWMQLFLLANRDSAADTVARRRLAAVAQQSKDPATLHPVLSAMWVTYIQTMPLRWTKMQPVMDQLMADGVTAPGHLPVMHFLRINHAVWLQDTGKAREFTLKFMEIPNALSPAEKADPKYLRGGLPGATMGALDILFREAYLDSLRRGSAGFLALKRANWENAAGRANLPLPGLIGRRAPTISADFWFSPMEGRAGETAGSVGSAEPLAPPPVRPTPGKVSLVIFLGPGCRKEVPRAGGKGRFISSSWNCAETYAMMRRMAKQFPALEMTIVAQTAGFLGQAPPVAPNEEAKLMREWWLGFHQLPATVAVSRTEYFNLPAPDSRRIDHVTQTEIDYGFDKGVGPGVRAAFLVDEHGMVLLAGPFGRYDEDQWREMLDAIMNRPR